MRNLPTRRRATLPALGCGLLVVACGVGDGSDIGPELPEIPDVSCRFVVLDDQSRGVVGATVSVGGTTASGTTGRNGRGDFLAEPRGRRLVRVETENAAATNGDTLRTFQVATSITGRDLPAPLFAADFPLAASTTLTPGTQPGGVVVTSTIGSQLQIAGGASVGAPAGAVSIDLRLGDLAAHHLPGDLPQPATGGRLFSRGLWIEPADVTFTPAAVVDIADDLGLGTGQARLYRFDPSTGEWTDTSVDGTGLAGRITASGANTGGLYAFAVDVAATTVSGRVIAAATPASSLPDVMVLVDHVKTVTDGNGNFVASGIAATLANGAPRSCVVEAVAGGSWLPVRTSVTAAVVAGTTALADLPLDTVLAGNIRVQQVLRGRAEVFAPARLSSLRGDVALSLTSDAQGQVTFEDVPAEYFGFQDGRARDTRDVFYGQAIGFLERGRRWLDAYQFFQQRAWYLGGRRTRAYASDAFGGGPVYDAAIMQGAVPGEGFAGETREGGVLFITRDFAGRATATVRTERDGRVLVHAYSIVSPNGEHLELPLQRVLRTPLAAFARHGLLAGTLLGADPGRQHAILATRRLSAQEWWDDVIEGMSLPTTLPLDVDPATTHGPFVAGVPATGGNLAAIEFTAPGGDKTLQKVAIAADAAPVEGARIARDLALDLVADTTFTLAGALSGADSELALPSLQLALALQQPSGRIVPIVRDLDGNFATSGADVTFTLPELNGTAAGHGWLGLLHGNYVVGNDTLGVGALVSLPRGAAGLSSFPVGTVAFDQFPDIVAPAANATVPADGFTVQFTLPANALHGSIELRNEVTGETRLWQALVPRELTDFAFVRLPNEAVTPLLAGRTWTLTVSAYFGDGVVTGTTDPYRDLSTFAQSIGSVERGVWLVQRRSIQITTN